MPTRGRTSPRLMFRDGDHRSIGPRYDEEPGYEYRTNRFSRKFRSNRPWNYRGTFEPQRSPDAYYFRDKNYYRDDWVFHITSRSITFEKSAPVEVYIEAQQKLVWNVRHRRLKDITEVGRAGRLLQLISSWAWYFLTIASSHHHSHSRRVTRAGAIWIQKGSSWTA